MSTNLFGYSVFAMNCSYATNESVAYTISRYFFMQSMLHLIDLFNLCYLKIVADQLSLFYPVDILIHQILSNSLVGALLESHRIKGKKKSVTLTAQTFDLILLAPHIGFLLLTFSQSGLSLPGDMLLLTQQNVPAFIHHDLMNIFEDVNLYTLFLSNNTLDVWILSTN